MMKKLLSKITKYLWYLTFALTLLIPLAFADLSYAVGLVFSDGFEDNTTNKWTQDPPHSKCPVVSSALDNGISGIGPHSGTKMMRCNWFGGSYEGVSLDSWNYTDELFLRFWHRNDNDVDIKRGSKMLRLGFGSGGGQQETYWSTQFELLPNAPMFMYWKTPTLDESYWPGSASVSNPAIGDYLWHKLELYIKHDTSGANGVVHVWIDDTSVFDRPNILSHVAGSKWFPLHLMSNWSMNPGWEHDDNNHVYWDDLEIYSDAGTGSTTGSMPAGTIAVAGGGTTYTVTVTKAGTGTGSVDSAPSGIACGATCVATYNAGDTITLTATPSSGSVFAGWSAGCSGTDTCTIASIASNQGRTATFTASTMLYLHDSPISLPGTFPTATQSGASPTVTWSGATTTLRNMNIATGTATTVTPTGTSLANTSAQSHLIRMFVSPTLSIAQTVGGGTWRLNLADQESNVAANFWVDGIVAYVWRPSTGAKIGANLINTRDAVGGTEPTAADSLQSTTFTFTTGSVSALAGDVIIAELWATFTQADATARTLTIAYDGITQIPLTENSTVSTPASYLLISEALTFGAINTGLSRTECASPPPGTIFCEDFEGATPKANFDDFDGNLDTENLIVTHTGPQGDASNKAIRLRVPAGQSGGSDLVKVLPPNDELYLRYFIKYEDGFNFAAPNHGGGLHAGDRSFLGVSGNRPTGADFAYFLTQYKDPTAVPFTYSYYRGMYQDCTNPVGSCFGDALPCVWDAGQTYCTKAQHFPPSASPVLADDTWYCFEERVNMGTPVSAEPATGHFTLWKDNVPLGDFNDLWLRTSSSLKLDVLWLALFHHDTTHSVGGEILDNVVVSTQRIACPIAGTQGLVAPSHLTVGTTVRGQNLR